MADPATPRSRSLWFDRSARKNIRLFLENSHKLNNLKSKVMVILPAAARYAVGTTTMDWASIRGGKNSGAHVETGDVVWRDADCLLDPAGQIKQYVGAPWYGGHR